MPDLIIGLGNPGGAYAATRHNLGWRCLDELAQRGRLSREQREGQSRIRHGLLEGFDTVLARPLTYMNLSGRAALQLTRRYAVEVADVIVIYDEIDLPLGRLRLRRGGGAGGHNGVRSLIESLKTADFIRVRLGVGRPPDGVDPADYVLRPFAPEEREHVDVMVTRACDAVATIIREGLDVAMNLYNRKPDA